jgi:TM2 domain-containing membrane protein YozV
MGHIRRRVDNYTILILPIDKGQNSIDAMAALRVRDGKEAGSLFIEKPKDGDPEIMRERFDAFQDFLSNDLVLLTNYSDARPVMDKLYQGWVGAFFTNTAMDALPQLEEAASRSGNPEAFRAEMEKARQTEDLLAKARAVHGLYEKAADILFGYQEGYPYWISRLPKEEERYMALHLPKRKTLGKAAAAWAFGLHYFYLGEPKRNILYLLTLGGCLIWTFFDLYRLPLLVDEANERIAEKVYAEAPKINVPGLSGWIQEK